MENLSFHPECQKIIDYLEQNKTDNSKLSIDQIRKNHFERFKIFCGGYDQPFDGERTEVFIPSPDVTDGIPVFVYTPKKLFKDPAIFVYFHGGGFVLGTRYGHDTSCKAVSSSAGCIVVNVEYRLAPEHKFPAMMDDAAVAVTWVKDNKVKLGGTKNSKVGVGGDSAGGTITASIAHDVPVDFQVLIYPNTTKCRDYSLESMVKYADGPLLTQSYIKWFIDQAVPAGEESNPRLATILRPKFDHLPPALFIIAEHDPLYTGSWMYANKLKENGVSVEVYEVKGAIHAYYGCTAFCPTLCAEAFKNVSDFIKKTQSQ